MENRRDQRGNEKRVTIRFANSRRIGPIADERSWREKMGGGEFDFREIIGGMLGNNVLVEHSSLTTTNYGLSPSVLAEETRNIEGVSLPSAALRIECFWNSVRNSSEYRFACSRTLIAVEYVCWTSIKVNRFHATYLYSSTFSSTHARAHTYSRIQQLSLT